MKKQLEIATIKANITTFLGGELFWVLSRNQLEFLFKEIEISSSPPFVGKARYQGVMLPVISFEKHYGLKEMDQDSPLKYLVVRSVNEKKELEKIIVQTPRTLKIKTLEGVSSLQAPALPQNSENVLGIYSLAPGKLGIVPDITRIIQSLQL
ncbi:MAG: chemotaxis protein CheW [Desulforhopalus sp.]